MNSKGIFKKQNILPVVVLLAICVVVAGILGAVNLLTAERIEENENAKIYASLTEVMDGYITPVKNLPEGTPKSVTAMYDVKEEKDSDELLGKIVTVSVKGYAGNILMTVGVYEDGTVSKVVITSQSESHGKAGMATYTDKFTGVTGTEEVEAVEHFAGATISSTAIRGGVADAVDAAMGTAEAEPEEVLPKTDEEILDLAGKLVGDGVTFENVTPEESNYTKRIYKASGGRGYVAYIVVMSRYGTPETETLVHFTNKGVISGIEKLTWSPSPANPDYGYYPPSEDVVDAYYTKYVGKTAEQIYSGFIREEGEDKEIEHASGATSTSIGLATSVVEAGVFVEELIRNDMPRDEEEVIAMIGELVGNVSIENVTPDDAYYARRIYKLGDNKGFVAYLVVISRYGTPETETLVHFDNSGRIAAIKKIVWSPSPANPEYGYYPPSEEVVDAFYAKFIGQTIQNFEEKFIESDSEDAEIEHAAGATSTSMALSMSVLEALEFIDGMIVPDLDNTPRIVGIAVICAAFASVAGIITYKFIKRRRAK